MIATALTLLLPLALPAPPQDRQEAIDPVRVEQAVKALSGLGKSREFEERMKTITDHGVVRDRRVCDLLSKAVDDRDSRVSRAALYELRRNAHPRALEKLHGHYRKNRTLRKDAERYVELIKAIGSKSAPESVKILEQDAQANAEREVVQARIYALGNIRTKDSVALLMKLMRSSGGRRGEGNAHMQDFQVALMQLTGQDFGRSKKDWLDWWNDSERKLEIAEAAPRLPDGPRARWERFWGLGRTYDRRTKRSKRGDDPERD